MRGAARNKAQGSAHSRTQGSARGAAKGTAQANPQADPQVQAHEAPQEAPATAATPPAATPQDGATDLTAQSLWRWQKYLEQFELPAWDDIPDFGLYMDQVVTLLTEYLDYLPPEIKEERVITPATVNNYVRLKIMPKPVKKKYYRRHIAYLIVILTLKQSLGIAGVALLLPPDLGLEELRSAYESYARRHSTVAKYFIGEVRRSCMPITRPDEYSQLPPDERAGISAETARDLVETAALMGGFSTLLAEKIVQLQRESEATVDTQGQAAQGQALPSAASDETLAPTSAPVPAPAG